MLFDAQSLADATGASSSTRRTIAIFVVLIILISVASLVLISTLDAATAKLIKKHSYDLILMFCGVISASIGFKMSENKIVKAAVIAKTATSSPPASASVLPSPPPSS